jgi:hypothetical protein
MNQLDIHLDSQQPVFAPGSAITGKIAWQLEGTVRSLDLRLFWYTQSLGEKKVQIVETMPIDSAAPAGQRNFRFGLPDSPYSFTGKLIRLNWSLELVAEPGAQAAMVEFVLSPVGRPIDLCNTKVD